MVLWICRSFHSVDPEVARDNVGLWGAVSKEMDLKLNAFKSKTIKMKLPFIVSIYIISIPVDGTCIKEQLIGNQFIYAGQI